MTDPIQICFAGPAPTDHELWRITHDRVPELQEGEVHLKLSHVSVDPAMRGWITNKRSYIEPVQPGEIMRAFGVGEVVASKAEGFAPGDWVTGFTGLASEVVVGTPWVRKIDISLTSESLTSSRSSDGM